MPFALGDAARVWVWFGFFVVVFFSFSMVRSFKWLSETHMVNITASYDFKQCLFVEHG